MIVVLAEAYYMLIFIQVLSGTTTAGGQAPLSVATFASSSRPPSSSLSTVTDVRTQHLLSQVTERI